MRRLFSSKAVITTLVPVKSIWVKSKNHLNGLNTLLILMLAFTMVWQKDARVPVVFSKGSAIASFAKELNDKGVSDEKQRLLVNRFASALPKALAYYAQKHHVVIFNDKDVVAGAPNITPNVLVYIATEMTRNNQGNKNHD